MARAPRRARRGAAFLGLDGRNTSCKNPLYEGEIEVTSFREGGLIAGITTGVLTPK